TLWSGLESSARCRWYVPPNTTRYVDSQQPVLNRMAGVWCRRRWLCLAARCEGCRLENQPGNVHYICRSTPYSAQGERTRCSPRAVLSMPGERNVLDNDSTGSGSRSLTVASFPFLTDRCQRSRSPRIALSMLARRAVAKGSTSGAINIPAG